jgi:hypothetical protein
MDYADRRAVSDVIDRLYLPYWRLLTAVTTLDDLRSLDYERRHRSNEHGYYHVPGAELADWRDVHRLMDAGFGIHMTKLDGPTYLVERSRAELSRLIRESPEHRSGGQFPLTETLEWSPLGRPPNSDRLEVALPHLSTACFADIYAHLMEATLTLRRLEISGAERDAIMNQAGVLAVIPELDAQGHGDGLRDDYLDSLCELCGIDRDSFNMVPEPFPREPPSTPDPPPDPTADPGGKVVRLDPQRPRKPGRLRRGNGGGPTRGRPML